MSKNILYISYTGILDPLGQSQVLQYVVGLARDHSMTLLTFEKPEAMRDEARVDALLKQCRAAGVDWCRLTYHNRPNIPATLYDLFAGIRKSVALARCKNVSVVHCRSYLAGLMGLAVKKATGARHIFDMRGFWPDERVDGGIWSKESAKYKIFKALERLLFLNTDYVVSLTRAGAREFSAFPYLKGRVPPVSVIPTCTNLDMFRSLDGAKRGEGGFTLGYVGSVGSWYMFEHVARAVRALFELRPDARFLVVNKGGHDAIRAYLEAENVDLSRVEIKAVPFDGVSNEIARMDAGVFFIKPAWSKRASCPTRMGEFLACGKPCLTNVGVGDVEEDFNETGTGVAIGDLGQASLENAIDRLLELCREPGISARCRTAAQERFALERGTENYANVYAKLGA